MVRDVYAKLSQHADGKGIDPGSLGAGGKRLKAVAQVVIDQPFSHLGAAGVMGAEEKDTFFHGRNYIRFGGYNKSKSGTACGLIFQEGRQSTAVCCCFGKVACMILEDQE